MKKYVLILIAAAHTGVAFAGDDAERWCSEVGAFAETAMDFRQAGLPLDEILKIVNKDLAGDQKLKKLSGNLVKLAYHEPLHQSEKMKRIAIVEFKNKQQLHCLNASN